MMKCHKICLKDRIARCETCSKKIKFCLSIFDRDYWKLESSKKHFNSRLVCLNKNHPKTPDYGEYRPIVVTSYVIKLLELSLLEKLQNYNESKMTTKQLGFVKRQETKGNLLKMSYNYHIKFKSSKKNKRFLLYLDLSSAYDRVIRSKLYEILERKKIMDENEINLLKAIHNNIQIKIGDEITCPMLGLPQGLI